LTIVIELAYYDDLIRKRLILIIRPILLLHKKGGDLRRMGIGGILQTIIGGIGEGSIYALLGLSFVLIFGKLRICSVLHGDLSVLGAYIAFWSYSLWKIDPFISLIYTLPIFFIAGYFIQRLLLKPFMAMETWQGRYQGQIMVTWGVALVVLAFEYIFWTGTYRTLATDYRNLAFQVGETTLTFVHLVSIACVFGIYFLIVFILKHIGLGISLRACSDNRTAAMVVGINYHRICSLAFGISSSIAVVAGVFYSLTHQITPSLGLSLTFKGWVAVIMGGMGSLGGVIAAGLLLGVIESLTAYLWIPALKEATLFGVLILVLIAKPEGLFQQLRHQ
jgi:branched-chain amino acid transport system permease protein